MAALPSKLGERRRKRRIFWSIAIPVLGLLCIGGVIALSHWQAILVSAVDVRGASSLSTEALQTDVAQSLAGSYLGVFPKRNIFLYPAKEAEASLLAHFSRLKSAALSFENFHTLTLSVSERKLHALWCGAAAPERISTSTDPADCDFLDEDGFIFSPGAEFSGAVYLRYFGAEATSTGLGVQYLPSDAFKQLDAFAASLPSLSFSPVGVELLPESDAAVLLAGEGKILFSRTDDYAKLLDNLRSILAADAFKKNDISSVDYIDLRFGDKVFYKFR